MYKFSKTSLKRLEGVHPKLKAVLIEAIANSPYDFLIVDGVRSAKRQNEIYQEGRTKKGIILTNCDGYIEKSKHQLKEDGYGYAVDIGIYNPKLEGKIDWGNINALRIVVNHIKTICAKHRIKISWGGEWKNFKDYPHLELTAL